MNNSLKIDSHQHFWKYDSLIHAWIDDSMAVLKRDFLPQDLEPILEKHQIDGCVAVQADQSKEETDFLLELAGKHVFIKGIVGWVDLQAKDLEEQLSSYFENRKIKGFRHVLQDEINDEFILKPEFINGLSKLAKFDFTYDILIFPKQLASATKAVRLLPNQKFVLDHIAKPSIVNGELEEWKRGVSELSKSENVYCKLSGMVTEAKWNNWKYDDFVPYMDFILESFGSKRLLFGSDWPVCTLSGDYEQVLQIVDQYIKNLTNSEQAGILGENAVDFYKL
ncbi:amidohydrolase family protein [Belliella sp. DSM 107340]|uniref:Amidohydrolase family protein n=1 Tax=Belliella calami TaxID=2923436 RepID=A0ABS9UK50_9BACT|nr:amidohydrolase family protein [Belliella calami]MCH7396996.1 amidohydrolase family protein [Belliella calami]